MSLDQRQLCDIQGRLFVNALKEGYAPSSFIPVFMNSSSAAHLDDDYDRLQWAGEEYILEELTDENVIRKGPAGHFTEEAMFWIGYLYRYWHYYAKELSKDIYKQADEKVMETSYDGFHTLDPEMAVDRLKEINELNRSL
ncbi:hypothetical protein [Allobaculum sp. JKK-2023]|uniref:hypothetical protein n=1 Tax=Allobaculum sp. JKK-2023 TaxID=3108943 RepID=UPI002B05608B|nr:hypothetical protein [Allobaculum sp. JKK-2023]